MLALSGGLSRPWFESRCSKYPTGLSSGHSLHRAQGRGERKEQKAAGEQGEPWHGTFCPVLTASSSSSSAPCASFATAAQAIGELVSCPPPPPARPGAVDAGFPRSVHTRGGSRCPMGAVSIHVRRGGGEALGSGFCGQGGSGPAPFMAGTASAFAGSWGVGACSCPRAAARAAGVSGVSGQGCPRAGQRGQGLRWELKALWGDKGLIRGCSALSDPSAHYLIRAGCLAGHGVE